MKKYKRTKKRLDLHKIQEAVQCDGLLLLSAHRTLNLWLHYQKKRGATMPTKSAISFGLVYIPITLHTATTDIDIRFNQLHKEDGERIRYKKVCGTVGQRLKARISSKDLSTTRIDMLRFQRLRSTQ